MARRLPRRETVPFLHLLPNLVTIIGLCAGLTSIRFAVDERFQLAALLIIFAALIDGLDGLLARRLNATSPFGAELDSLSDFLNFGVAPGVLIYHLALPAEPGIGWALVLVYAICCCLRLARFNVSRDLPTTGRAHFVGVPAPAGALLALLPAFLAFEGVIDPAAWPLPTAFYLGAVGILMVSRFRTLSPKAMKLRRAQAAWVLVATAALVGLLISRFWLVMVLLDLIYLAILGVTLWVAARRARKEKGAQDGA